MIGRAIFETFNTLQFFGNPSTPLRNWHHQPINIRSFISLATPVLYQRQATYPNHHCKPRTQSHSPSRSLTAPSTYLYPAYIHLSLAKTQQDLSHHSPLHSHISAYYLRLYNGCESLSSSPPYSKSPRMSMCRRESPRCIQPTRSQNNQSRIGLWRR